jgi:hypothetical protein
VSVPEQKLASPRVSVLLEGHADPLVVQTRNPDLCLWDRTRAKHKWPKLDEAPFVWLTFLAWAALRRTGGIPADLTYEKFEASTLDVSAESDDDENETGAPFPEGLA